MKQFEADFAKIYGVNHVVSCANGTDSLYIIMKMLGIKSGDEVITVANSWISSSETIGQTGATPVFVDIDPIYYSMDLDLFEKAITPHTKAVIMVHLQGQAVDLDQVEAICKKHNIYLIEDCAQSHFSEFKGRRAGTVGIAGSFSFYPGKNLGACGEAGGISTNNEAYQQHLHSLRNHGSKERYFHDEIGYNYRMGGLEGASLSVKLNYLETWNNKRREVAKKYHQEIVNPKVKLQSIPSYADGVHHLFVVTVENKEAFVQHLSDNDINAAYHYPVPCHLQKAYASLGYKVGDFPNSEYLAAHCVSLPMYAELTEEQVSRVISAVNSY